MSKYVKLKDLLKMAESWRDNEYIPIDEFKSEMSHMPTTEIAQEEFRAGDEVWYLENRYTPLKKCSKCGSSHQESYIGVKSEKIEAILLEEGETTYYSFYSKWDGGNDTISIEKCYKTEALALQALEELKGE